MHARPLPCNQSHHCFVISHTDNRGTTVPVRSLSFALKLLAVSGKQQKANHGWRTFTAALPGLRPFLLAMLAAIKPHTACPLHAIMASFCSKGSVSAGGNQPHPGASQLT